jgi:signal transduction histidine kinase
VTLTGQAIVAYEVFTGKSLPRGGLQRYWRWTLLMAVGIGALTGFYLARNLPALYGLLAGVCGLAACLALLSRQSYEERKRFIADLRPFVAGPQSYAALLAPASPSSGDDVQAPFRSLCSQLLGSSWAVLTPQAAVAELFGPPLVYPPGGKIPDLIFDTAQFSPEMLCLPLDPGPETPPAWAVPLWNPLGLCGVLLLGEKSGGGVYTQEEIEVARSACERLVDAQAGAEAARRLLALQRRQLAESQVLDRRARRILHDDVLPQLHAALLAVNAAGDEAERNEAVALLAGAHRQIADLLHDIPRGTTPQTITLGLAAALRQVAEEELRGAFENVTWRIDPAAEKLARSLPPFTAETIFYAAREVMRNAARHAQPPEASGLRLEVAIGWADGIEIRIADNGIGEENGGARPDPDSTAKPSSGSGLALHRTLLALVGGTLELERTAAGSACVRLWAPMGLEPGQPPAQNGPLE